MHFVFIEKTTFHITYLLISLKGILRFTLNFQVESLIATKAFIDLHKI